MKHNGNLTISGYLDLVKGELRNAQLQNLASDPSEPVEGQAYYNTATNRIRIYSGAEDGWIELGPSTSSFTAEEAQDAVGGILTDTGTVDFTYDDGAGTITAEVLDSPSLAGENGAHYLDRANHTGTQSADTIVDGATNHVFTAADDTKLAGVATGATANSTDATLLNRANHTGTQPVSTISDFNTAADARAQAIVDAVVDAAPGTLDTLNELAAALGDDPNFATTITDALASRTEKYAADFGDGSATTFAITHSLGTSDVQVSVRLKSTNAVEMCDVTITDANTVTLSGWTTAPASAAYRVVVIG